MANSILSSLSTTAKVSFFDSSDGRQLFSNFKTISADITYPAKVTDNPSQLQEDTQVIVNEETNPTKVIEPVKVTIVGLVSSFSTMRSMIQACSDNALLITISSKSISVKDCSIVGLEIEQSSERLSVNYLTITFEQVMVPSQGITYLSEQDADSDDIGLSVTSPTSVTLSVSSLYDRIVSDVGFR